jgi:hypothetical protein
MTCRRSSQIDPAAFLVEPEAEAFAEFRAHYPRCPDCAQAVAEWSGVEDALREVASPEAGAAGHPKPEALADFAREPQRLSVADFQQIDRHSRACRPCADEIAALRSFDFEAVAALAPVRPRDALASLGRSLRELARGVADEVRERATALVRAEPEGWLAPEPAVAFQSAGPAAEPPLGVLVGLAGAAAGRSYAIAPGRSRIGRGPECEIRIDDPDAPREAAVLEASPERVSVRSAREGRRIVVGGAPVADAVLDDGASLEIGGSKLVFRRV